MTPSDVDNPYGLGAHALETVLKNENPFEAFMILFMAIVLGYFVIQFFRNKTIAKNVPAPIKSECAKCLFDHNAFADFYAEYKRDHETTDSRQKHMLEEMERMTREFGKLKDKGL